MSSSVHIGNKKIYVLILGKGPGKRLNCSTLTTEAIYLINLRQSSKSFE